MTSCRERRRGYHSCSQPGRTPGDGFSALFSSLISAWGAGGGVAVPQRRETCVTCSPGLLGSGWQAGPGRRGCRNHRVRPAGLLSSSLRAGACVTMLRTCGNVRRNLFAEFGVESAFCFIMVFLRGPLCRSVTFLCTFKKTCYKAARKDGRVGKSCLLSTSHLVRTDTAL